MWRKRRVSTQSGDSSPWYQRSPCANVVKHYHPLWVNRPWSLSWRMHNRERMWYQHAGLSSTRKRWSKQRFVCQCRYPSMGSGDPILQCKFRKWRSGMILEVESSYRWCRQKVGRFLLLVPDSWQDGICCWKRNAQLCLIWNRAHTPAHTLPSNLHYDQG